MVSRLLREIEESPLIRKVGSKIAVVTGADGTIGQEVSNIINTIVFSAS